MVDNNGSTVKSFYEEGTTKAKKGIRAWIFSTDHKRISLLYLCSVLTFFVVGVILGELMRLELIAPGQTIVDAETYNKIFKY